jgi:flagellar assembly protein FliH
MTPCAPSGPGRKPAILFDEDFDAPPAAAGVIVLDDLPDEVAPPPPAVTAEDVAAARADAYAEGHETGLAQAAADRAEVTRQMLGVIADRLEGARQDAVRVAEEGAQSVARLLMGTLAGMLPTLCARHGAAEVAAVARAVLPALVREPRVTIRVSPHLVRAVEQALAGLDPDLHGRVMLVPTDAVPPGDVRIAWADGAAVRETAALWRSIAEALEPLDLLAPADLQAKQEAVPA